MDDLKSWWEIAQLAGAGAAVVLGPASWLLWRRNERDTEYIREADKNNLVILNELTKSLDNRDRSVEAGSEKLMQAIERATETIKGHIDKNYRNRP